MGKPGRPPIIDEFTNLPISRERKRQLRKIKNGLCAFAACDNPIMLYPLCLDHAIMRREIQRRYVGSTRRNNSITYRLEKAAKA